jgi:YaiO family outer membrane protein
MKKLRIFILLLMSIYGASAYAAAGYDELIQESLRYRNEGKFQQAESSLRQALPLASETNEVAYLLGMVVAFQQRFVEASRILDAALVTYPHDIQLLIGKARVLSYQGHYTASVDAANSALALAPGNTEALALKARVHYYQRQYSEARRGFNGLLDRDPDNLEALIGLYDVESATGNDAGAAEALNRAERIDPTHTDVTVRRDRTRAESRAPHELTAGYAFSNLDPGFQHWQERSVEYRYHTAANHQVWLRSEHAHRFGLHDTLFEVGGVLVQPNRTLGLALAYTPDDDILPQLRLRIDGSVLLIPASERYGSTTLGLALSRSLYAAGDVQWLKMDLTHYFLHVNAWLSPAISVVRDELGEYSTGWSLGMHWQARTRLLVGYNYTHAPETELNITTLSTAHHLYGRFQVTDSTSLRLDGSRITRQNSYSRDTIAVSLQHRF